MHILGGHSLDLETQSKIAKVSSAVPEGCKLFHAKC